MKEPVKCTNCGKPYRADKLKRCPSCAAGEVKFSPITKPNFSEPSTVTAFASAPPRVKSSSSNASRIAIQSAKIVNGYGTVIQVIGMILGVLMIIGGILLAHQSGNIAWVFVATVIGLLDLAIFAVQGALFRMVSNYVIAQLEN